MCNENSGDFMRLLIPLFLLGCNSSGTAIVKSITETTEAESDDTDTENDDTGDISDSGETADPDNDTGATDTQDTQDTQDTDDTDDTEDSQEPVDTDPEPTDWQNNAEWSAYSTIQRSGCNESEFYEYGTIYPNNPQEDWYDGCPSCNHIYVNYAYFYQQPYAPCGIGALIPMYRGVDYIDNDGDNQTDQVDIYYWPTGNPADPQLLGTAQETVLDDGTPAWNFSYTLDVQGSDPDISTSFVFYNWY